MIDLDIARGQPESLSAIVRNVERKQPLQAVVLFQGRQEPHADRGVILFREGYLAHNPGHRSTISAYSDRNVEIRMTLFAFSHHPWASPLRGLTGGGDGFVARLTSDGALTWNTFLGGSSVDEANSIAVDGNSTLYVGG